MLHVLSLLIVVGKCLSITIPSQGEVWPKPSYEVKQNETFALHQGHLKFEVRSDSKVKEPCNIIATAIERCKSNVEILYNVVRKYSLSEELFTITSKYDIFKSLLIELNGPCKDDEYPYIGMDETYNLTISKHSVLRSASVWGLIRGLETFSQLFYIDMPYKEVLIKATIIEDEPNYKYRSYMLDTSRHYIQKETILVGLEAMAMDKLNVFHWHITDDQSFPFQSESHPELSKDGAYAPLMVYTHSDVKEIVEFARDRGIMVLPEFDTPSHATSWGKSHPELVLKECEQAGTGALNPTKNETYVLLEELYDDIFKVFPAEYVHLGSDEPVFNCWLKDDDITLFMNESNMENVKEVYDYFFERVLQLIKNKTPVVWQEAFTIGAPLIPFKTVVEVWSTYDTLNTTISVLNASYNVVLAEGFYLDHLHRNFKDFYENEPRMRIKSFVDIELLENLIGGDICMWGERVDDSNMISRSWPRASAAAEVLWSETYGILFDEVWPRIHEHSCRMKRRGIDVSPPGPGYCLT